MAKFKCSYCGGIQSTDGICKQCDMARVYPIEEPEFMRGATYRCHYCRQTYDTNHGELCPCCGTGKVTIIYKNHRNLRQKQKVGEREEKMEYCDYSNSSYMLMELVFS